MDCSSASDAERVCDCGDGVQWPNDKNPIFFMPNASTTDRLGFPAPPSQVGVACHVRENVRP